MPPPFVEFERRLRWADADAAGRLHFPRIFEIIEEAEWELLRAVGWLEDPLRFEYDFPRVNVNCDFRRILSLDAPFRLRLSAGRLGRTSIRYDYQVFEGDGRLAIQGTMTVVAMRQGRPAEIPDNLRAALSGETE